MKKLFLFVSLMAINYGILFAEEITITTYYPSPYGSYRQLTVSDKMAVGDVTGDGPTNATDLAVVGTGSGIVVNGGIKVLRGVPPAAAGNFSNTGYSFNYDGDTGMFRTLGTDASTRGDIAFVLDSNERMRISGAAATAGNVGIGTANPARRLHILNNGPTEYVQEDSLLLANQKRFNIVTDATNGASTYFRVLNDAGTGGTNLMLFNHATGNVGIGAVNPQSKLDVRGITEITDDTNVGTVPDTRQYASFGVTRRADAVNRSYIGLTKQGWFPWGIGIDAVTSLIFGTAFPGQTIPTPLLTITPGGNISAPNNVHDTCGWYSVNWSASHRTYCPNGRYIAGIKMEAAEWTNLDDVHTGPEIDEIYCCTI